MSKSFFVLAREDKAPFLLAAVMALASASVVHLVSRITGQNVVKLEEETGQVQGGRYPHRIRFKNLSSGLLTNIRIDIVLPDGQTPNDPTSITYELPMRPNQDDGSSFSAGIATYPVSELHPGWQFEIAAPQQASRKPDVRFRADQAVLLLRPGLRSTLVEYEVPIVFGIAVVTILLAVIYLGVLASRGET